MTTPLDDPKPEIEMLTQPLLTPEGFVNPACMNELQSTIDGMPKTHDRLATDPEWSRNIYVNRSHIVGTFAMWACRQSPYIVPDGLENVTKYLAACLKTITTWNGYGFTHCSLIEINRWLYEILYEKGVKEFDAWNQSKKPTGEPKDPDTDFIDLDALLHNVCVSIRDEHRASDAFSAKFDAEWVARAQQLPPVEPG